MKYSREIIKRWLAFALALSVGGLSLGCLMICAAHTEQFSCALDEAEVTSIELEDECCSLDALKFLPPDRVQKTPVGFITLPLLSPAIFGCHHCQALNPIAASPQPAILLPLQRIPALRI